MENEKVKQFYDEYTNYQISKKINIRHRSIFNTLKRHGLKKNSNVLEIGCGIGTVTSLIAKYSKYGKIVAVDISPKSIDIAKKIICRGFNNIEFIVSDMSDFKLKDIFFDFIVFPDVLEHIPIEQHLKIFQTIERYCHENTKLLIHIPSPAYQRWLIKNKPELLQIIDQPVDSNCLIDNFYSSNFHLIEMKTYSLHIKEGDYQYYLFGKGSIYELDNVTYLSYFKRLFKELMSRIIYWKNNIF